ncbi:MAG: HipA N-terminal domain-containing protein [Verrucomicrobia bacterium]|nr:HipA N-terminal domain-containing protein [Verrucomicrobiota bacterium]
MNEKLIATYEDKIVGYLNYSQDRLTFVYEEAWQYNPDAFPLSLSMPLIVNRHSDELVRPFISGLLPDNLDVLRRWGQRYQVSARNSFRLLAHVGEECAGAVQFVSEDKLPSHLSSSQKPTVTWFRKMNWQNELKR